MREKLEKDLHTMRSALSATERRGSREEGDEQKDEDKPANDVMTDMHSWTMTNYCVSIVEPGC